MKVFYYKPMAAITINKSANTFSVTYLVNYVLTLVVLLTLCHVASAENNNANTSAFDSTFANNVTALILSRLATSNSGGTTTAAAAAATDSSVAATAENSKAKPKPTKSDFKYATEYNDINAFIDVICKPIAGADFFYDYPLGFYSEKDFDALSNLNIKYINTSPGNDQIQIVQDPSDTFAHDFCAPFTNNVDGCDGSLSIDLSQAANSNGKGGVPALLLGYYNPGPVNDDEYAYFYYTDGKVDKVAIPDSNGSETLGIALVAKGKRRIKSVSIGVGPPKGPVTKKKGQIDVRPNVVITAEVCQQTMKGSKKSGGGTGSKKNNKH